MFPGFHSSNPSSSGSGRKSSCVIGLDVGGTKIAGAVIGFPDDGILVKHSIPTISTRDSDAILEDAIALVQKLVSEVPPRFTAPRGMGVGICELVDAERRIVSAHSIDWRKQEHAARLNKALPTVFESDVRAAALAEARFGVGRGYRSFLYFTVGTGISCCLVVDGKPHTGARGAAGTMASAQMPCPPLECFHGKIPTLEEVASGPGLVARYTERGGRARSGQDVVQAAGRGDDRALQVLRTAGETLGATIGMLVGTLDPAAVIVGGGLGSSAGFYWNSMVTSMRRHIWWDGHRDLPVVQAGLGADAGVIGAAYVGWDRFCR